MAFNKGIFQPGEKVVHKVTGESVLILEYFPHDKYAYKTRRYNSKTGLLEDYFCYEVELERENYGKENKKVSSQSSAETKQT